MNVTSLAIRTADRDNTIRFVERNSRLGGTFIAIEDDKGIIEVASDMMEAENRVKECRA